jgi:crotonobetainyl-CoA:carnitine CoA-transferase CaiB-like acyl-CoA transferase
MTARPLPLDGVTVLAVEQYGAGPFGSMFLADLGAEVIKIENPAEGGDVGRHVGPFAFAPGDTHFFQSFNRNITLNIKSQDGMRLLRDLARQADAVLDNLRGDLPERLGLTHAALRDVNPAIVCAHLSAYGRDGPRRNWPGYDYLMQAEAGYLSLTGEPEGPPSRFGLSIVDMMTGLTCAFALVSGVLGARATGQGMDVDTSLFDTALQNLNYLATWFLNAGHVQGREPRSAHPSLTPSQLYRTRDGWIFLMCNKQKFWPILAEVVGRPDLAADPRFATFADRLANRDALTAELDAILAARGTGEWLALFGGTVPAAPVYDVGQALSSQFVTETGRVAAFARREGGAPVTMLAGAIRVDGATTPARAAPALGADTQAVLGRIGVGAEELADLRARKIV